MFSKLIEIEEKYGVQLSEGENFKQAIYNGRMTDSLDCVLDKVELAIKHYPGKNLILSTYESDQTSPRDFCFAVVVPVVEQKI